MLEFEKFAKELKSGDYDDQQVKKYMAGTYPLLKIIVNEKYVSRQIEIGTNREYYAITAKGIEFFHADSKYWKRFLLTGVRDVFTVSMGGVVGTLVTLWIVDRQLPEPAIPPQRQPATPGGSLDQRLNDGRRFFETEAPGVQENKAVE